MADGAFTIYKDKAGEFRFRFRSTNGNIIFASSEGYKDKRDCQRAVEIAQQSNDDSLGTFEAYQDNAGEHRFRFTSKNGNIIFSASEGYSAPSSLERAMEIAKNSASADVLDES